MKMILAENGGQCNGYSRHTRGRHPFESWEDSKVPLVAAVPASDHLAPEPRRSWGRDRSGCAAGRRRSSGCVSPPLRKTARGASSHGNAPVMIAAENSGDANDGRRNVSQAGG